jgi:hypothetical protein
MTMVTLKAQPKTKSYFNSSGGNLKYMTNRHIIWITNK